MPFSHHLVRSGTLLLLGDVLVVPAGVSQAFIPVILPVLPVTCQLDLVMLLRCPGHGMAACRAPLAGAGHLIS